MAQRAKIQTYVRRWLREETGATAAEYAVLLCLIVVALIGSIVGVAQAMQQAFNAVTSAVNGL
jgi:Flp pilus assembly pilin Flp